MSKAGTKKVKVKKTKPAKSKESKKPKQSVVRKEPRQSQVEEKVEAKEERVERPRPVVRPTGQLPRAQVSVRHDGSTKERGARGYSWSELATAGLGWNAAHEFAIPVDIRRRSKVSGNVERLKKWLQNVEPKAGSVSKTRTGKKK